MSYGISDTNKKPEPPAVAYALWIVGWVAIVVGGVVWLSHLLGDADNTAAGAPALSTAIAGILFIAVGSIVDRLSSIEEHLRPQGKEAETEPKPAAYHPLGL